jgi:queuine tRNA-ribosyltransferase
MKMNNFNFTITHKDINSSARTGVIKTPHGHIRTPAFVPVGTAATVKAITPEEFKACNLDVFFVNTYHMLFRPGTDVVKHMGGLHTFMNWTGAVMTDSAGFQAFSLGEFGPRNSSSVKTEQIVRIREDGISFKSVWDGSTIHLGPIESMKAQQDLGSDIVMAFDECTFYPISEKRAREAMMRTHRWLEMCVKEMKKTPQQSLYGIVQGSVFENLRRESAEFIAHQDIRGIAIGSVANSKEPREKVFSVLDWTLPILLPIEKPIHFLGIGEIEDIILSVEKGIDSLDCITPTRMGRMGWIFDKSAGLKNKFRYDISSKDFVQDKKPLVPGCTCYTCANYSRSYIHHLFRCRELLAYRLATIHNLMFFGNLMEEIRDSIHNNSFITLKNNWLR